MKKANHKKTIIQPKPYSGVGAVIRKFRTLVVLNTCHPLKNITSLIRP